MGRGGAATLIPARFLLMLAHFVVAVCTFFETVGSKCHFISLARFDGALYPQLAIVALDSVCWKKYGLTSPVHEHK